MNRPTPSPSEEGSIAGRARSNVPLLGRVRGSTRKLFVGEILPLLALVFSPLALLHAADAPKKILPLPGEVFQVQGHTAFVILPQTKSTNSAIPWVWYAPTLKGLPGNEEKWMFERFTQAGIAIAGIDVGESYGSPDGRKLYSALHDELTQHRGFATKAVMLGRSRGGLMTLCWAAENADKVAGFAGIYPVCNIASYPGVTNAASAYHFTPDQLAARLTDHNPIDRLDSLAKTGVPLFAIHGDVDQTVPIETNSGEMRKRYEALGGKMQLIIPPGQGHNMWNGFFQCQELVDFVIAEARHPQLTLTSPIDHQVVQRQVDNNGSIVIGGFMATGEAQPTVLEARITADGEIGEWKKLVTTFQKSAFRATLKLPAGGWYRLEIRALNGDKIVGEATVEHVGVGEIFVVAGQSNSANHGEEKQSTQTGKVATFNGKRWQLSSDPQPGASGGGGSFLPPFGDAIAKRFNVPVGFIACGIGASSVREWLPKGAKFPNPPTITSRVQQLSSGEWESKGEAFEMFVSRMKQLEPHGFRAVLWHQGESDANQADTTRTLAGKLYREYLGKLIRDSRRDIGWTPPWFVAQVSYHVPGDEASPDIRSAQTSLWKDGVALEGPDTDALKSEWRENGGKGVHFSGAGLREHAARWVEKVATWLEQQIQLPADGLILDLDAERGVTIEDGDRVSLWQNQVARFVARDFVKRDEGRKEAGSGRPTLRKDIKELNGHSALVFRGQELACMNEDAFDDLTRGGGCTWLAVLSAHDQQVGLKDVNSIFGNLKNGGNFEGLWANFTDDNIAWWGARNGVTFGRFDKNNPQLLGPKFEKGKFYVVAGRMAAGTGNVKLELFVNTATPVSSAEIPVNTKANPSKLAIGQERDAINHPGHESFDGEIARFQIYARPLDEAELKSKMCELRERYGIR